MHYIKHQKENIDIHFSSFITNKCWGCNVHWGRMQCPWRQVRTCSSPIVFTLKLSIGCGINLICTTSVDWNSSRKARLPCIWGWVVRVVVAAVLFLIWPQCVAGNKAELSDFCTASCLVAIKTEERPSSTSSPSFITIYKYTESFFFFFFLQAPVELLLITKQCHSCFDICAIFV